MSVTRYPLSANTTASILGTKRLTAGGAVTFTPTIAGPTGLSNTAKFDQADNLYGSYGGEAANEANPAKSFGTWFDFYAYGRNICLFTVYVADWPAAASIGVSLSGAVGVQYGTDVVPTYASMDPALRSADGYISNTEWNRYRLIFPPSGVMSKVQVFKGANRHGTTPDFEFDFWDLSTVTAYGQIGSPNTASGMDTRISDLYMGLPTYDAYPTRSDTSGTTSQAGAAALTATSTLTANATVVPGGTTYAGAAALTATSTLTADATVERPTAATLTATATLTADAEVVSGGGGTLVATSTLTATSNVTAYALVAMTATGTLTAGGTVTSDTYYPGGTRPNARPTILDDPADPILGGPSVLLGHSKEVEAISDDLNAAADEGVGGPFANMRDAVAALWAYALAGRNRANHTGSQLASTISDLASTIRGVRLDEMAAPTADLDLNGRKITDLATPTASTDAVTKAYADALAPEGSGVPVGCVPATNLVWDGNRVTVSIVDGSNAVDAIGGWLRGSAFSPSDVGKAIHIDQGWEFTHTGNPSGDGWIRATITAYVSPTRVIMSRIANRTTNEAVAIMGTNNDAAMSAHLAALAPGERLYVEAADLAVVNEVGDRFCFLPNGDHTIPNVAGGIYGPENVPRVMYPTFVTTHRTNNMFKVGAGYQRYRNIAVQHAAMWSLGDHWLDSGSTSPQYGYKPSHPTAGAGFFQDYPGYVWWETRWHFVGVYGMWDGIKISSGTGNLIEDCWLYQCVHTCLEAENPWNPDHIGLTVRRLTHGGDRAGYTGQPGHGVHVKSFGGLILRDCTAWGGRFAYLLETSGLSTLVDVTNCDVDDFGDAAHSPSGSATDTSVRLSAIAGTSITGGGIIFVANNGSAASAIGVLGCYIGTVWNAGTAPVQFLREGSGYLWNVNVAHIKSNYTASGCSVKVHNLGAVQNLSVVGCSGGRTSGSQVLAPVGFTWNEAG